MRLDHCLEIVFQALEIVFKYLIKQQKEIKKLKIKFLFFPFEK